jgi:TRAP-type C4-dicarboxylate transport system substrate-binding protein
MEIHVLSIIPSLGFRNVQNRLREVRTPSDMKGLKIRVTKSDVERLLLSGWGAVAIPFDWATLYEGLETGVVDGMYIPDAYVAAQKFYEVTPYITKTGGAWNTHIVFMGKGRYDALPDWAKEVVDRVGAELQKDSFAIDREWEMERLAELEGNVQYYEPTEDEMRLWYADVPPVWVAVKDSFDPELARRVLEDQEMTDLIQGLEEAGVF